MKLPIRVSMSDVEDGTMGICLDCGELAYGVEPDARGYTCECCDKARVFGLEEALIMGAIELDGDDGDDADF